MPDYMREVGLDFNILSFKGEIELGQGFGRAELFVLLFSDWGFVWSQVE